MNELLLRRRNLIASIVGGGGNVDVDCYMQPIIPMGGNKITLVDEQGYIGFDSLPVFQPSAYNSYAIVIRGADFSDKGLGQVTLLTPGHCDIGGRTYRTVIINGVEWLAENLDYKASNIPIGRSDYSDTEPRANYYNNDEATYGVNGNKYGLLYNWPAVKYLNDNRATLMPGWHVASTSEWDSLANAVGGASIAGTKLKSKTGWSSGNGDDTFNFSAYPAGYRNSSSFLSVGSYAYFWTSIAYSSTRAYYRYFDTGTSMSSNDYSKFFEYSVRLVKDSQ